jgi:hypothetical protein
MSKEITMNLLQNKICSNCETCTILGNGGLIEGVESIPFFYRCALNITFCPKEFTCKDWTQRKH